MSDFPSMFTPPATEEKAVSPDEVKSLEMLKSQAKMLGIPFSNNIGMETLAAKIKEHMEKIRATPAVQEEAPEAKPEEPVPAPVKKRSAKHEMRLQMMKEQSKLIRVRVTSMNPDKAELGFDMVTVANDIIGKQSRLIPLGDKCGPNGWHIPQMLYTMLKNKKFYMRKTHPKTNTPYSVEMNEYNIEVLPPLTEAQLKRLQVTQTAANGAPEEL